MCIIHDRIITVHTQNRRSSNFGLDSHFSNHSPSQSHLSCLFSSPFKRVGGAAAAMFTFRLLAVLFQDFFSFTAAAATAKRNRECGGEWWDEKEPSVMTKSRLSLFRVCMSVVVQQSVITGFSLTFFFSCTRSIDFSALYGLFMCVFLVSAATYAGAAAAHLFDGLLFMNPRFFAKRGCLFRRYVKWHFMRMMMASYEF